MTDPGPEKARESIDSLAESLDAIDRQLAVAVGLASDAREQLRAVNVQLLGIAAGLALVALGLYLAARRGARALPAQ